MSLGGLSVATTADLNAALGAMEDKFDSHRKWTENQIADFIMKLRSSTEKIDNMERDQSTSLESMNTDLKALRVGCVTNQMFRTHVSQVEKNFEQAREDMEHKLDQQKMALEKDITTNISNLRLKAETLNANCIALTEKSRVIEETLLPSLRTDCEEQKQKRLCETQRLESEIEKVKEVCEQKVSHTAAALRFYVTATATKLREEMTPLTTTKELEVDLAHKEAGLKKGIKSVEDLISITRSEVTKQREHLDASLEKYTLEIGQHTKSMKVLEINMNNLHNSIATDMSDVREEVRNDVAKMKIEVSDTRASATRAAMANENAIQVLTGEINPLRSFRELILDRLHIEKFVNVVREWQTTTIPQVTSSAKDLEDRAKKITLQQVKDHEVLIELQKSTAEIRRHFKLFHTIASGLDDKPHPAIPDPMMLPASLTEVPQDTRLPPISSARGGPAATGASLPELGGGAAPTGAADRSASMA
eukprot:TRINITY_DN72462_c0_g1_i1.p1 TRINITY_DN72462_c0_g1~~TRINITY_DN72462_c0_g1_i1.p1  ORF type:complete len:477 (+),score=134.33 TRINITY_DN72462_c0_g1_i1:127-1557(+)